jgi:hypothetical protein
MCNIEILDTSGSSEYESIIKLWMAGKDAFIYVFSMQNESSLDKILNIY